LIGKAIDRFLLPKAPARTRQKRAQVLIEKLTAAAPYNYPELFEAHRSCESTDDGVPRLLEVGSPRLSESGLA
jgi:hypothetical protein